MPKRTREESILRCRKLWEVEAVHGIGSKEKMYKLAKLEMNDKNYCPACEYMKTHKSQIFCNQKCIIKWPGDNCLSNGTPFDEWYKSHDKRERKFYAQQIVELCNQALKEFGINPEELES